MATAEWQTVCTSFKERGALLLKSGEWTDCKLLVGPEATPFPAHKLMLASASPVFEAMFFTDSDYDQDNFALPDVEPNEFEVLLNFIYTEDVDVGVINSYESAQKLYITANKFLIPSLAKLCVNHMICFVSMKTACSMYEAGSKCQDHMLMSDSMTVIQRYIKEILYDKSFEEADIDTVAAIFAIPELGVEEIELYEALERYAWARSSRKRSASPGVNESGEERTKLHLVRKALQKIRFRSFTLEQFARGPAHSGFFTPGEVLAVFASIAGNAPMPAGFSGSRQGRHLRLSSSLRESSPPSGTLQVELSTHAPWRSASSPQVFIGGRPWLLTALRHLSTDSSQSTTNYIALFLTCEDSSAGWVSKVRIKFSLLPRGGGAWGGKTTIVQYKFSSESKECVVSEFIDWRQAVEPARGYLKEDGSLTLQAHLTICSTENTPLQE